jgi:hypothetical protein
MAYPLTSETGNLTCTVANSDLNQLFTNALRMTTDLATINIESNEIDVTQASGSAINFNAMIGGLRTGTVEFSGIYPRATTPLAVSSEIVYGTPANGYVQYCNAWNIDIAWPEIDITSINSSTPPTWRRWMPGGIGQWSGSYTCKADDTTPPVIPLTGSGESVTFKFAEAGATDPQLAGTITVPRLSQRVRLGDYSELTYNFRGSGNLTQTTTATYPGLLSTTTPFAITKPSWDVVGGNGIPDVTCTLTVATGRTWSFPAFWTRLNLAWKVDDVIRVSGTLRIADTATVA